MRLLIYLFVLISLISTISAQDSPTNCKYNGIDYGFLSNSTGYSSTDSANQYTYYFNVCGTSNKCNPMNIGSIAACQIKNGATNPTITAVGMIGQGTFGIHNQVVLNYKTSTNPCSSGSFRNINIYLVPGNTFSVSQTIEESKCQYAITLTYPSSSSGSSSSNSSSNSSSSSSSSDNNNNSGKVICENSINGLSIQSFTSISCSSYGKTSCIDNSGLKCATDQTNIEIECNTNINGKNQISCSSSNISCSTAGVTCSVNSGNYFVNRKPTDQTIVTIDTNNTSGSSDSGSGSQSNFIKLSFNIVILVLISSFFM